MIKLLNLDDKSENTTEKTENSYNEFGLFSILSILVFKEKVKGHMQHEGVSKMIIPTLLDGLYMIVSFYLIFTNIVPLQGNNKVFSASLSNRWGFLKKKAKKKKKSSGKNITLLYMV